MLYLLTGIKRCILLKLRESLQIHAAKSGEHVALRQD